MKNIDTDFRNAQGKAILFLGRFSSLNEEEIKLFLEKFEIRYTTTLDDDVAMAFESTILSPIEEEIAAEAYKRGVHLYNSDQFDKLYADRLNSDAILMSLKLSNNQQRLARLLHNRYLSDALFIKLFAMIDWGGEGMFDNSENMKLATLFAKRFFSKSRFDSATYHSPISVFEVAIITENPDLLDLMFDLPQIEVKQSRSGARRPTTTREAIAINPHTSEKTLTRLFRLNNPAIDLFLARNPATPHTMQERIFARADAETKEALALNENLSPALFEALSPLPALWLTQKIEKEHLQFLPDPAPAEIGENENLSEAVIDYLLEKGNTQLLKNLAQNPALNTEQIEKIYTQKAQNLHPYLGANPNTPEEILHELFARNDHETNRYLALNTKTPLQILEKLFTQEDYEINCSLALNEALPIPWLQQLQIDTRLLPYLKENRTFTENILQNLGI